MTTRCPSWRLRSRACTPPPAWTRPWLRKAWPRSRFAAWTTPAAWGGRAGRLVQAERPGRYADRAAGGRRGGQGFPVAHELDPGAAGGTAHLRRLPQPAPWRLAQLGYDRQRGPCRVAAGDGQCAPIRRDDGVDANPAGSVGVGPGGRPD